MIRFVVYNYTRRCPTDPYTCALVPGVYVNIWTKAYVTRQPNLATIVDVVVHTFHSEINHI